mmetsp:Transcript_30137/g.60549  ORF Transcript_30137/g.60549 Transcript_30137/m.60549 type:complete len:93 (+) Transcript_30137:891-1169(+)
MSPGSRQLTQNNAIKTNANIGQYINANHHGIPEFLLNTMKTITNVLNTKINGTVTNVQNGQHGPAAMIGLPSFLSSKKKNEPTLRAQQQKYL